LVSHALQDPTSEPEARNTHTHTHTRVEADDGYRGHADKVKCTKNNVNPIENLKMQGHVRAHHETLNGHLKNWGILPHVIHHGIWHHGDVFWACTVITQLTIEHGEPLFAVEYGDKTINTLLFIIDIIIILSIHCI
jgi:hypothetical protein